MRNMPPAPKRELDTNGHFNGELAREAVSHQQRQRLVYMENYGLCSRGEMRGRLQPGATCQEAGSVQCAKWMHPSSGCRGSVGGLPTAGRSAKSDTGDTSIQSGYVNRYENYRGGSTLERRDLPLNVRLCSLQTWPYSLVWVLISEPKEAVWGSCSCRQSVSPRGPTSWTLIRGLVSALPH